MANWFSASRHSLAARPQSEVTQRLSSEIASALRQPQLQTQLAAGGYVPVGSTPEALQAHIEREITRWAAVVKSTGAKVD